ncbi:MAG TPA: hypothetical protein VNZ94_12180 [Xanthobacteraceae bacterium]|nr:hypothetical protein [Xanthobacteraceae bacterium]
MRNAAGTNASTAEACPMKAAATDPATAAMETPATTESSAASSKRRIGNGSCAQKGDSSESQ